MDSETFTSLASKSSPVLNCYPVPVFTVHLFICPASSSLCDSPGINTSVKFSCGIWDVTTPDPDWQREREMCTPLEKEECIFLPSRGARSYWLWRCLNLNCNRQWLPSFWIKMVVCCELCEELAGILLHWHLVNFVLCSMFFEKSYELHASENLWRISERAARIVFDRTRCRIQAIAMSDNSATAVSFPWNWCLDHC